jgi:molecular chaperone DnaJ
MGRGRSTVVRLLDILATIIEKDNNSFDRDGETVYTIHWISAFTAMYSSIGTVINFDNKTIRFPIPAGIQHGTIIDIKNAGLPVKNYDTRGDLKVIINVYIPTELEEKDITAVKRLAKKYNLN